ncbi:phage protein Gp27 family protein, partial [Providencia rettgeri]
MMSTKREKEIRAAFAAEAATEAEKIVKQAGLTEEAAANIKRQILGIAQ